MRFLNSHASPGRDAGEKPISADMIVSDITDTVAPILMLAGS